MSSLHRPVWLLSESFAPDPDEPLDTKPTGIFSGMVRQSKKEAPEGKQHLAIEDEPAADTPSKVPEMADQKSRPASVKDDFKNPSKKKKKTNKKKKSTPDDPSINKFEVEEKVQVLWAQATKKRAAEVNPLIDFLCVLTTWLRRCIVGR
jgi:hypothetical protein